MDAGSGHVCGLCARYEGPLALMKSAGLIPFRLSGFDAPTTLRVFLAATPSKTYFTDNSRRR